MVVSLCFGGCMVVVVVFAFVFLHVYFVFL